MEREEELEKLRLELVEATKMARQLFGQSVNPPERGTESTSDISSELRLQIVRVNRELDEVREQSRLIEDEKNNLVKQLEHKDIQMAKNHTELTRFREVSTNNNVMF